MKSDKGAEASQIHNGKQNLYIYVYKLCIFKNSSLPAERQNFQMDSQRRNIIIAVIVEHNNHIFQVQQLLQRRKRKSRRQRVV